MSNHDSLQLTFDKLFQSEADAIFRFCVLRVSDREQARDLVQETFVRLWQTLQKGTEMTNARAFLFTVAHRLIIDWYRKKKAVSMESLSDEATDESYDPADEGTLPDNLELGSEGRFLMSKIKELNDSYRQAVFLRYAEGLSPPEIGKVLGISANAASVRVNRGIQELRQLTGYDIMESEQPSPSNT
ncbi:MAG: polymerase sigma factor, sigma-70 family [Candidatus Parcubacteria bacterium]|nr:polymerase sigma factor, sigma-70 family [Candidatus Parcubacteria bacterium]